ncbi:MAG: 1-deoxy-D-xylulose-5-phosphate synthase, partial [Candidatus Latescibacterota bacterium]
SYSFKRGVKYCFLSLGNLAENAALAIDLLEQKEQIGLYDMQFVKPLDKTVLKTVFNTYETIITLEDGVIAGGFGSSIIEFAVQQGFKNTIEMLGVPDVFIAHGTVAELQEIAGISSEKIKETLQKYL